MSMCSVASRWVTGAMLVLAAAPALAAEEPSRLDQVIESTAGPLLLRVHEVHQVEGAEPEVRLGHDVHDAGATGGVGQRDGASDPGGIRQHLAEPRVDRGLGPAPRGDPRRIAG